MNFIRLFNVEFDDKYDDVIVFSTKSEQSSYFSSRFIEEFGEDDLSVVKELSNVKVYGNYNKLQTVNYAYFENTIDDVTRGYYAFVTSVTWAGVDVVSLTLSIDVFQTYMFEHKLAPSYVRRASVHMFTDSGILIQNNFRTPENVDYGDEYYTEKIGDVNDNFTYTNKQILDRYGIRIEWVVIVCTEAMTNRKGEVVPGSRMFDGSMGYNDGLIYYVVPTMFGRAGDLQALGHYKYIINDSTGKPIHDNPFIIMTSEQLFDQFGASPQILGMYVLDGLKFPLDVVAEYDGASIDITISINISTLEWNVIEYNHLDAAGYPTGNAFLGPRLTIDDMIFEKQIDISDHFDKYYNGDIDPKALCFPYCYYSITQDRGNEIVVKPQYMNMYRADENRDGVRIYCQITTSVGVYAKQGVGIAGGYLGDTPELRQVVNTAIGQLPLVTDAYLNFLQTQKASFDTGMNQIYEHGAMNLFHGVLQGASRGGMSGGAWGAAAGAMGAAADTVRQTAMRVEQQQARLQDIQNTPDSLKKPGVDVKFENITGYKGICISRYRITDDYLKRVSDYFKLYGYTINDFITDFDVFLDTRETFNYVQTTASRVVGKINVQHIRQLESIYDHGVRLWHYNAASWTGFDFNKKNGDYYGTPRTPQTI